VIARNTYSKERRRFMRRFISATTFALAGGYTMNLKAKSDAQSASQTNAQEEGVSPIEDLMREHGLLGRILLIYGEAVRRIEAKEELPQQVLPESAKIIRSFIEDYHEKLEEDFVFPRFRQARRLVDLVEVLNNQHQAGRRLTDVTLRLSTVKASSNSQESRSLAESLRGFIRMYDPHHAWEDTVLFPAFREIVSPREYDTLGDDFEEKEHVLFGNKGFESTVGRVAVIEKTLGIFDLAQFTPKG
jgi:hemerythrin-like domain-containing protein